jgi:hypothetical protein
MTETLDPVCDRCGHRESLHQDLQRFCPFYSTFRAACCSNDSRSRRHERARVHRQGAAAAV